MSEQSHNVVSFPDREAIELQAASWVVRQGEAGLSAEQQVAFERWLAASDAHQASYERLAALWRDAAVLEELYDIADAVEPERPASSWLVKRRGILVATAAVVTVAAWPNLFQPATEAPVAAQDFVSAVGEQRTIDLPDGSVVQLNTETAISFLLTDNVRTVRLLRGEAFFEVAHDPDRRFAVQTTAGTVEAIGTAFATRLIGHDGLEVTVAEGRVAVSPRLRPAGPAASASGLPEETVAGTEPKSELAAGTSAIYTPRQQLVTNASAIEINRKLAWRDGVLVFAGEPLRRVIEDVSRYTDIDISISDKELEALPIGGYFRVGETEALFEALELTFNVQVERVGNERVRLYRGARKKSDPGT